MIVKVRRRLTYVGVSPKFTLKEKKDVYKP